ncbi:MAG: apolipoprotein N-acyltransferase [Sulfuricurvum sp.]|uniref:apolipoprotein N-acyltransferase n=1 Tax=Sulfuricurvum sp. TaxID=2025608 RepID=UPI0026369360|nr:apolipoprotein N-acyltransferase [Sulfuricurvum sp.]MDD2829182.1 apolipoprotein N-acyltransferase [Sulfuricurvum sp.]MDD4949015.1 apolipoprotein N-acyltransferase [Sulfuricurvum sp.]
MKLLTTRPYNLFIVPLFIALGFSLFIYAEYFHFTNKLLNTLTALGALYGLLHAPRIMLPIAGFWIGLLWFYWIGYSFQYYDLAWAQGVIAIGFGVVYALYFGVLGLTSNPFLRIVLLFGLTFIWPMDFNWMQPELIFVESYFGLSKWEFILILFSLTLSKYFSGFTKIFPLLLLLGAVHTSYTPPPIPNLKIKLVTTDIPQDIKWAESEQDRLNSENIDAIQEAIEQKYDLVVLPEASFALFMNHHKYLSAYLQKLSYQIPILTGTLYEENGLNYNVSYLFQNGTITVAKKTILVPFGEYIPLPSFIKEWVDRVIFGGASDFVTADKPTDFTIHGIKFRNAICYEATREELYTPEITYLIAMSNNGWFTPSIEPTLQNLLIRFYARKNHSVVFHSANSGGSGIVY